MATGYTLHAASQRMSLYVMISHKALDIQILFNFLCLKKAEMLIQCIMFRLTC